MLRVYSFPASLYCAKTRIVLRHKGLDWAEVPPPGGYGSDEYKTVVPSGNLPALVDGDLVIADSEAIAEYLEERYPDPPMLPTGIEDRALVRQLCRFHDTRLEPALRGMFPYMPGRAVPEPGYLERQADAISARLAQLAQILMPPETPGPMLSDCGYPPTFAWIDALGDAMGFSVTWPEPVAAYRARLAQMPAVAAELEAYLPAVTAFLEGLRKP
ncbi:MAG: glutathione S-transferase family protein [Pseudomonadota bacterium]